MAGKKSSSKIRRLMKRAEARGETYVPPEQPKGGNRAENDSEDDDEEPAATAPNLSPEESIKLEAKKASTSTGLDLSPEESAKLDAAKALERDLENIHKDTELKSKDRRSAKRRAEAIATESSGCSTDELLQWYEEYKQKQKEKKSAQDLVTKEKNPKKVKKNPYIVFVGQLSYDTTKEALFRHFENELSKEHKVTPQTMSIRLLTDPDTKRSRGMAFVEVTDPEILYACLKLHHTFLEGRRINVERSVGGKGESRKSKIQKLREEQTNHVNEVVDSILTEFYEAGSIQKGELDDGVIALCKRHSATVVKASLDEYVDKHGRDLDNSSAYLTFLIGKMAKEGIREKDESNAKQKTKGRPSSDSDRPPKKVKTEPRTTFPEQGVDMSISERTEKDTSISTSSIFPSFKRGRGRGQ